LISRGRGWYCDDSKLEFQIKKWSSKTILNITEMLVKRLVVLSPKKRFRDKNMNPVWNTEKQSKPHLPHTTLELRSKRMQLEHLKL
jgi:hypothetical protein